MRRFMFVAMFLASGCTAAPASASASPTPTPAVSASPLASASPRAATSSTRPAPTPTQLTFHNSASQARMVATLVAFLDAYNTRRVDAALALLAAGVTISDCDYRGVRVTTAQGTEAARKWLQERADDHDQLALESVQNDNPDPGTGSDVVGVS